MGRIINIEKQKIELPMPINRFAMSIGCDPGTVNLGIAVIEGTLSNPYAILFQVKIERSKDPIERIKCIQEVMSSCIYWYSMPQIATIEGAAFSSGYRQVELAEVRTTIALWCMQKGFMTSIVNPLTIRKKVLGNGKAIPHEVWTGLPPDATQALCCAYYQLM